MQPMHATQPSQSTQAMQAAHPTQRTHATRNAQPAIATLIAMPALPATATLAAVPALPATPMLAAVAALPATPTLATVAALPATSRLADVPVLPATAGFREGSGTMDGDSPTLWEDKPMAHLFICPKCGTRTASSERSAGFRRQAKGCTKCGFGFLFELLDDYYPAPDAAFFVCDQQGKVIGCGRGSFELTGLHDERVIGRPVHEVLGLKFEDGQNAVETVLEWGVRVLGKPVEVHAEGDLPARATADLFPAYDEDGGLLLVLTPAK
jgi:PAS domain-containing protein